jgi:glycosyltransferase involved in cell wall biosynthesis
MKISIITPAYNAEAFLDRTVDSVLAQTWTDWELVIVDDGSVDNTFAVAKAYAEKNTRIRAVRTENGGVANARNAGYRETNPGSEYVIFLDHDDIWKPHALERLIVALEEHPEAIAAHALARTTDMDCQPVGAEGGQIHSWERRKVAGGRIEVCSRTEPTTFAVLICDCVISTPGVGLIRRSAFEKINRGDGVYYDQSVASGDDWDMWLRLSLHGDIAFVDEVLLDWRQHDANGSKNEASTFAAEAKVRRKMANWPELNAEQTQLANWRYQRVYASIERRNARTCGQWACESIRRRRWPDAAKFVARWLQTYVHYLGLRLLWNAGRESRPIPSKLVDTAQVLK